MKPRFMLACGIVVLSINAFAQTQNILVGSTTRSINVTLPANLPENAPLLLSAQNYLSNLPNGIYTLHYRNQYGHQNSIRVLSVN